MPVYGLPRSLESSLNTLLTEKQPSSWRVSSHDDDITVVIRWPRSLLKTSTCDTLVHCKRVHEDSSGEESLTADAKHKRHMWSKHSKEAQGCKSKKEIEPASAQRQTIASSPTAKVESDQRRRKWEPYAPSPSNPSSPYPVYLTTSGQETQTFSYAYLTEKQLRAAPPKPVIIPPSSDDAFAKVQRHHKDVSSKAVSLGKRTHSSSSSTSTSSSSSSTLSTFSIEDHHSTGTSRRRIKSEPSSFSCAVNKRSSMDECEAVSAKNAETFYKTIARALQGYGQDHSGSPTDSHYRLGSPSQSDTSGSHRARTPTSQSASEDALLVSHEDRARQCEASIKSMQDSLTWDSLDCDEIDATQ